MTKKYYVDYVKACSPLLKEFNTKEELENFIKDFYLRHKDDEDCWINYTFKGKLRDVSHDVYLERIVES